ETERVVELIGEPNGYFSALVSNVPVGTLYGFRLGNDSKLLPDPASRFQPSGVHGPSQLVDPSSFEWHDQKWPGIELHGQIIYEMHVGTFTAAGTLEAAAKELAELKSIGITTIELMPVAEFAGDF